MPRRGTTPARKCRNTFWVFSHVPRRRVVQFLCGVLLVWIIYSMLIYLLTDHCGGYTYVRALCEQYRLRNAAGSLCYDLCYENLPLLYRCYGDNEHFRLFHFNNTHTGKVLLSHLEGIHDNQISLDNTYRYPEEGAQLSDFNSALESLLVTKLGEGDHSERIQEIWRFADFNNDAKMSLAEAKSIWSLLQIKDFFMHFIFSDTSHVPQILGTCGDTYFLQNVAYTKLYATKDETSLIHWVFPNLHHIWWPDWAARVKLCMGLLEFNVEAYQHKTDGEFYLCNITVDNLGYTENYEPKFVDLSQVVPKKQVRRAMQVTSCNADEDCAYTSQCVTKCNLTSRKCTDDLVRPSLFYLCQLIRPFILTDAPRVIRGDLLHLFSRCSKLQGYMRDLALQHSLVYTDLRSLLWRRVSSTIT